MNIADKFKKVFGKFGNNDLGGDGKPSPVSPKVAAELLEEERPLTKREQQSAMRCGVRAAGSQKILNLLARGTVVNASPQANMLLGSKYNLY